MSEQWRSTPSSILLREMADILAEVGRRYPDMLDGGDLTRMCTTFREWSRIEHVHESRSQPLQG